MDHVPRVSFYRIVGSNRFPWTNLPCAPLAVRLGQVTHLRKFRFARHSCAIARADVGRKKMCRKEEKRTRAIIA